MFFSKPTGGPDVVGGIFPTCFPSVRCWNRTGATLVKGETVMLAFQAAVHQATEIATNDSNSYRPGYSNDTVWNTVVDPFDNSTSTNGVAGNRVGGIFGIVQEGGADNTAVLVQFYGLIEEAFVVDNGSSKDGAFPGQVLSVTTTNSLSCHVGTNAVIVGFYLDSNDTTLTNRALKRVFLTNGMFTVVNGAQTSGLVRS